MLYSLNTYRIIGTLAVFTSHLYMLLVPHNILGSIGVELFFVLSGFTAYYSWGSKDLQFKSFIKKRCYRLLPMYIITVFAGLIYMIYAGYNIIYTFLKLPIHLFCLQTLFPIANVTIGFNSAAWYVATLLFCYFVFIPLKNIKYSIWIMLAYSILLYVLKPAIESIPIQYHFFYHSPFVRIIDFYIGIIACHVFNKIHFSLNPIITIIIEFFIISSIIILLTSFPTSIKIPAIYGTLFAILFIIANSGKGVSYMLGKINFSQKLSTYSYAFYLTHFIIIMTILRIVGMEPSNNLCNILLALLSFIMTCITTIPLFLFDQHFQQSIKNKNYAHSHS